MRPIILVCCLLTGCAAQPKSDDHLIEVTTTKTAEQFAAERLQDIDSANRVVQWKDWVCAKPVEEQKTLIAWLAREQGWTIVCPRKASASVPADAVEPPQPVHSPDTGSPQ